MLCLKVYVTKVSMGGATGLFIGASLLSFVEIFYYFTVRPYGSMILRKQKMTEGYPGRPRM